MTACEKRSKSVYQNQKKRAILKEKSSNKDNIPSQIHVKDLNQLKEVYKFEQTQYIKTKIQIIFESTANKQAVALASRLTINELSSGKLTYE